MRAFVCLLIVLPAMAFAQVNPAFLVKGNLNYAKMEASGDGLFGFEKDGKIGYMDRNEKIVIPPIYSYESETFKAIPLFVNGYVKLMKDGKYGILDKTGKTIFPFESDYLAMYPLLSNHAATRIKDGNNILFGVVNMQHKQVVPTEYDEIRGDGNMIIVKKNGLYGLFDANGKKISEPEFTALEPFSADGVLRAEKNGEYGLIDMNGKWLFQKNKTVYTIYGSGQGMVQVAVSGKYGFLDRNGNEVIMTKFDNASNFESIGMARVGQKSGVGGTMRYGYIDKKGNEVIPIKYEYLGNFSNGLVIGRDPETNRYGFLDKTGKWVLKPVYLDALSFDENYAGAWVKMTDGKWHYIDKTGKDYGTVSPDSYKNFNRDGYAVMENSDFPTVLIDRAGKVITRIDDCDGLYNFSDGLAGYKCKSNALYGFIDGNGNKVLPCTYTSFTGFADGFSKVSKKVGDKYKYGYINDKGVIVVPIEYDDAQAFRNGWGLVKKDTDYFFVDAKGNLKQPPRKYSYMQEFRSGYAMGVIRGATNQPNTYYYINPQLKEEFNLSAKAGYLFWDDVAIVQRNDVYELMNKKGEVFKSLTGIDQLVFSTEGLIGASQKNKWGFLDNKGDWAIQPKYDSCDQFKYGYARVRNGSKWGVIDKSGNEIFPTIYENIIPCDRDLFIYYDKSWGIAEKSGRVLVPPAYYSVTIFEKDRALARMGKTYTIIKSPLVKL